MCQGNFLDLKKKKKKKKSQRRMSKRNSAPKKRSQHGMCKETPDGEKCQTTYFWRDVSVLVLSLCLCLFRFVCFCFVGLFLRLSFIQILSLVVLSFYHFEGSFQFWVLSWGLVLRPFSACSVLMSFSSFSCFLWLLSLLVSFFLFLLLAFFCFFFISSL